MLPLIFRTSRKFQPISFSSREFENFGINLDSSALKFNGLLQKYSNIYLIDGKISVNSTIVAKID